MSTEKITVETTVAAPMEVVWQAYTTPEDIKQWNAASDDWHTTFATGLTRGRSILVAHGSEGREHGL